MDRKIIYSTLLGFLLLFTACSDDNDLSGSILDDSSSSSELDNWLKETFVDPYNIAIFYKWSTMGVDVTKALVPPKEELVMPFLKTVNKVWLEPFIKTATAKNDFLKEYSFRNLVLIGSGSYNNGSVTLGLAANGNTITLSTINSFDMEKGVSREDLKRFFHTMHHEFAHILNQKIPYDPSFKNITGNYTADWTIIGTNAAREMGFISNYARSADGEDFVEILAFYITNTEEEWNGILNAIQSEEGRDAIVKKRIAVSTYMKDQFGVDLDMLRDAVLQGFEDVIAGNID